MTTQPRLKLGFTGTRRGMSAFQLEALRHFLIGFRTTGGIAQEFHHGDCTGADAEAHDIARELGIPIHIHPPTDTRLRARCALKSLPAYDIVTYNPKSYLERNHDIVDACDWLIAAPGGDKEVLRSGTWATIRYAMKQGKQVVQIPRHSPWPE
jgi:hypothetical protein